ncbi:sugar transferase, partial [Acinetobacter johnsonii]
EKFKLDTWYVENQSVWLDFKIMLKTVKKVLAKDDINAENDATMPKFNGNEKK